MCSNTFWADMENEFTKMEIQMQTAVQHKLKYGGRIGGDCEIGSKILKVFGRGLTSKKGLNIA